LLLTSQKKEISPIDDIKQTYMPTMQITDLSTAAL